MTSDQQILPTHGSPGSSDTGFDEVMMDVLDGNFHDIFSLVLGNRNLILLLQLND